MITAVQVSSAWVIRPRSKTVSLDFSPAWYSVENGSLATLLLNIGSNAIPSPESFDHQIPPESLFVAPAPGSRQYGLGFGAAGTGVQQPLSDIATVTWGTRDEVVPTGANYATVLTPLITDRQTTLFADSYNALLSPHAATSRLQFVAPVGYRTVLEYLMVQAIRFTAAGPAGLVAASATFTHGATKALARAVVIANTPGNMDRVQIGTNFIMSPGDSVELFTEDSSTGGLVEFFVGYKATGVPA